MKTTITKTIGATERTLRALLDRELATVPLPFEGWTILVFLGQGDTPAEALVQRLVAGGIVPTAQAATQALERAVATGWVEARGPYGLTTEGAARFREVADRVEARVASLLVGIDDEALDQTEAVLGSILARAKALLAG